ncbi:hypothetical protein [Nocardia suismassiliense]|uniref:hypothetical protein n=1 Tax=Nocardia suismassiliense TaxID=2077092 RepID=UPI000D1D795E|nr:hypothetical protein [Nocardia suismassiliense]
MRLSTGLSCRCTAGELVQQPADDTRDACVLVCEFDCGERIPLTGDDFHEFTAVAAHLNTGVVVDCSVELDAELTNGQYCALAARLALSPQWFTSTGRPAVLTMRPTSCRSFAGLIRAIAFLREQGLAYVVNTKARHRPPHTFTTGLPASHPSSVPEAVTQFDDVIAALRESITADRRATTTVDTELVAPRPESDSECGSSPTRPQRVDSVGGGPEQREE